MSLKFTHNRLHVGYRLEDWSDVWYEPLKNEGTDEYATELPDILPVLLYKRTRGEPDDLNDPMEGEVAWSPWFDPDRADAKTKKERLVLQKRFLADVHRFLREKDSERVRKLTEELDYPLKPKWQSCFKLMKKLKTAKMRISQRTRQRRIALARQAGIPEDEIVVNSDSSDSEADSAYASDVELVRKSPVPTAAARSSAAKRKRNASNNATKSARAKKARPDPRNSESLQSSDNLFMSAALGDNDLERNSTLPDKPRFSGVDDSEDDGSEGDRVDTRGMGTRNPTATMPPPLRFPGLPEPWNFGGLTTPKTTQQSQRDRSAASRHSSTQAFDHTQQEDGTGHSDGNSKSPVPGEWPAQRKSVHRKWCDTSLHNGAMTEDEAYHHALRASLAPGETGIDETAITEGDQGVATPRVRGYHRPTVESVSSE